MSAVVSSTPSVPLVPARRRLGPVRSVQPAGGRAGLLARERAADSTRLSSSVESKGGQGAGAGCRSRSLGLWRRGPAPRLPARPHAPPAPPLPARGLRPCFSPRRSTQT